MLRWFDIKTTSKKRCGELINISWILKVESNSTMNRCYPFDVDWPFIINEILRDFRQGIWILNWWEIAEDVSAEFHLSLLANSVGNLWSICLGVNILRPVPCVDFLTGVFAWLCNFTLSPTTSSSGSLSSCSYSLCSNSG